MIVKAINIILANTVTTDDLTERLSLLRGYYQTKLFGGADDQKMGIREYLKDRATTEEHIHALEEWERTFQREQVTGKSVYDNFEVIQKELDALPTTTIYVPVKFPQKELQDMGEWFRREIQPNMMLEVKVDVSTVGGCAIVWGSVYHDISFRYFMRKKRAEVITMFNMYEHSD